MTQKARSSRAERYDQFPWQAPGFAEALIGLDFSSFFSRCEFLQQRFGLLQVFGVKPLGEPAVDLRQHLSGFCPLALLLPQTSQTHRCPQFQRLRLLPAGNLNSLPETLFSFLLDARP